MDHSKNVLLKAEHLTHVLENASEIRGVMGLAGDCEDLEYFGPESRNYLIFGPGVDSPYKHSLAEEHELSHSPEGSSCGVSGMCRACNNVAHVRIDRDLMTGVSLAIVAKRYGISEADLILHLKYHCGPIYKAVGESLDLVRVEIADAGNDSELFHGIRMSKRPIDPCLVEQKIETTGRDGGEVYGLGVYSMQNGVMEGALRPWTRSRGKAELEVRVQEALDYFSEMMGCKEKAERVYDAIMDGENDTYIGEDGKMRTSAPQYGAAISAVKEVRGVVTDLVKMSLIAAKLGNGEDGKARLNPRLQGLVDSVYGNPTSARLISKEQKEDAIPSSSLEAGEGIQEEVSELVESINPEDGQDE